MLDRYIRLRLSLFRSPGRFLRLWSSGLSRSLWMAIALVALQLAAQNSVLAQPGGGTVDAAESERLYRRIADTPLEQIDLEFFKSLYRDFDDLPSQLKTLLGREEAQIPEKNKHLGELRKFYDWSIQAEYARDNHVVIENTNQGKDNGARSDLDATGSVLDFETHRLRDEAVRDLIKYQNRRYSEDGLSTKNVDVALFNGDAWLPDWRDHRLGYTEYTHRLVMNVYDIKSGPPGAYYVPEAHKEQAHDRALGEGHTIHVAWDYLNNLPTVNGLPFVFDSESGKVVQLAIDPETGRVIEPYQKIELVEYVTSEEAKRGVVKRYAGIQELQGPDKWRRSFGNLAQNLHEYITHYEPISRNKYFMERLVDQAFNRVANVNGTYEAIHKSRAEESVKNKWKEVFIRKAFGVEDAERIREIQSVLDRSAQIQIDYKAGGNYEAKRSEYYAEEIREVRESLRSQGIEGVGEEVILKKAEALFVVKQRRIAIEGGLRVVEFTFAMEFTPEGIRRNRNDFASPLVAKKIMFTRGFELSLFLDMIETNPAMDEAEKLALRESVIQAIPAEVRDLALRIAELAKLKMDLIGRAHREGAIYVPVKSRRLHELLLEIHAEMQRIVGEADPFDRSHRSNIEKVIDDVILYNLGPVEAVDYIKATKAPKSWLDNYGTMGTYGARVYWNELKAQFGMLDTVGASLSLVNTYQMRCIDEVTWSDECVAALGTETVRQVLESLPLINTVLIFQSGASTWAAGQKKRGFFYMILGVASVPSVAELGGWWIRRPIRIFVWVTALEMAGRVTYGYTVQKMEQDFVEQAFKSRPVPGRRAEPYSVGQRGSFSKVSPPVIPVLAELVEVPADDWDVPKRTRVARVVFSDAIESELRERGLETSLGSAAAAAITGQPIREDPDSEWTRQANDLAWGYGNLLPYMQRMSTIYSLFHGKVEAKAAEVGITPDAFPVDSCLEIKTARVEAEFALPPGYLERLRFWGDRAKDKAAALARAEYDCVLDTAKHDDAALRPVFSEYVDGWVTLQARYPHGADYIREATPDLRKKITDVLIREYVMHRHLKNMAENGRQLQNAAQQAKDLAETRARALSTVLRHQKIAMDAFGQALADRVDLPVPTSGVVPEVEIGVPSFAVRLGEDSPVEVSARGEADRDRAGNALPINWQSVVYSEIESVRFERPDNLLMTLELEKELQAADDRREKRFVSFDEKLTAELRDSSGEVLATDAATLTHYEVVDWAGEISVVVQAGGTEGAGAPSVASSPSTLEGKPVAKAYEGAEVSVVGAAQATATSVGTSQGAIATFSDLPPGSYIVRVQPQQGDMSFLPIETEIELVDLTPALGEQIDPEVAEGTVLTLERKSAEGEKDGGEQVVATWKDRATVTLTMPEAEVEVAEDAELSLFKLVGVHGVDDSPLLQPEADPASAFRTTPESGYKKAARGRAMQYLSGECSYSLSHKITNAPTEIQPGGAFEFQLEVEANRTCQQEQDRIEVEIAAGGLYAEARSAPFGTAGKLNLVLRYLPLCQHTEPNEYKIGGTVLRTYYQVKVETNAPEWNSGGGEEAKLPDTPECQASAEHAAEIEPFLALVGSGYYNPLGPDQSPPNSPMTWITSGPEAWSLEHPFGVSFQVRTTSTPPHPGGWSAGGYRHSEHEHWVKMTYSADAGASGTTLADYQHPKWPLDIGPEETEIAEGDNDGEPDGDEDEPGGGEGDDVVGDSSQDEPIIPTTAAEVVPTRPDVAALIRAWLQVAEPPKNATEGAQLRYTPRGQAVGRTKLGIMEARGPQTFDPEYVWRIGRKLDSVDHCTMEEFVLANLQGASIAHCRGRYKPTPTIRVARVLGEPALEAKAALEGDGLVVEMEVGPPAQAEGDAYHVAAQDPAPGVELAPGDRVRLTIHGAWQQPTVEVPNVVGQAAADARSSIEFEGLTAEIEVGPPAPSADTAFAVASQEPGVGAVVDAGSSVQLTIWDEYPQPDLFLPDVVGLSAADAKARVESTGLVADITVGAPAPRREEGFVVSSQSPAAGRRAEAGSTVHLNVYDEFVPLAGEPSVGDTRTALSGPWILTERKPPSWSEARFQGSGQRWNATDDNRTVAVNGNSADDSYSLPGGIGRGRLTWSQPPSTVQLGGTIEIQLQAELLQHGREAVHFYREVRSSARVTERGAGGIDERDPTQRETGRIVAPQSGTQFSVAIALGYHSDAPVAVTYIYGRGGGSGSLSAGGDVASGRGGSGTSDLGTWTSHYWDPIERRWVRWDAFRLSTTGSVQIQAGATTYTGRFDGRSFEGQWTSRASSPFYSCDQARNGFRGWGEVRWTIVSDPRNHNWRDQAAGELPVEYRQPKEGSRYAVGYWDYCGVEGSRGRGERWWWGPYETILIHSEE